MEKLKKIPEFKSEAEEATFWAAHDSTAYVGYGKADIGFFPELKPSSRTISVGLAGPGPVAVIARSSRPKQSRADTPS